MINVLVMVDSPEHRAGAAELLEERSGVGVSGVELVPQALALTRFGPGRDGGRLAGAGRPG